MRLNLLVRSVINKSDNARNEEIEKIRDQNITYMDATKVRDLNEREG